MAERPRLDPVVAEPADGSPADWFARGFEAGAIEGASAGVREIGVFQHHARSVAEAAANLAKEAKGLEYKLEYLTREMQRIYGETDRNPNRWKLHPMYLRGAEVFERREAAASGRPTMQQQFAAEAREEAAEKPKRARRPRPEPAPAAEAEPTLDLDAAPQAQEPEALTVEPEPVPTLNLDGPDPIVPDPDADLSNEEQMRRAAGRAWRA